VHGLPKGYSYPDIAVPSVLMSSAISLSQSSASRVERGDAQTPTYRTSDHTHMPTAD